MKESTQLRLAFGTIVVLAIIAILGKAIICDSFMGL